MHISIDVSSRVDGNNVDFWLLTSSLTSRAVTVPAMAKSSFAYWAFMDICRFELF
jgi:hypothetical protein